MTSGSPALDLTTLAGPRQAERLCERIAATGALDEARERALSIVAEAKAALPALRYGYELLDLETRSSSDTAR